MKKMKRHVHELHKKDKKPNTTEHIPKLRKERGGERERGREGEREIEEGEEKEKIRRKEREGERERQGD